VTEEGNHIRLRASIQGRVQGVGFRWHVQRAACSRNLTGWVRNTVDGGVELEVEGPPTTLEAFMEDVRRGPSAARVDAVSVDTIPPEESDEFNIRF